MDYRNLPLWTLWCLALFYFAALVSSSRHSGSSAPSSKLCSSLNCQLPECFCAGRRSPDSMQTHDIPQMVMLTFDDAVNKQNIDFYREVLTSERTNPNGCPITATFFVSHDWTDYKMVKELYLAGHEIADHSISHRLPRDWWSTATYRDWEEELEGQRKNIANKAGVPKFEVKGVRVPFLEVGGDRQFELMTDGGFLYDSSFLSGPYNERDWRLPAWPFTLEFAPELEYCDSDTCPTGNFSSIWEVPLNRWLGLDGQACPMVDACTTHALKNKKDALRYLWKNFNRHYGKNRAPFGINLHATWLEEEFKLEALLEFVDGMLELHDVYLINIAKVIEWMRTPTTLAAITRFEPWLDCGHKRVLVQRREPTKNPPTKSKKMIDDSSEEQSNDDLPRPKVIRKTKKNRDDSDERDSNEEPQTPRRVGSKKLKKKKIRGSRKSRPSTTIGPFDDQNMDDDDNNRMLKDDNTMINNDNDAPHNRDNTDLNESKNERNVKIKKVKVRPLSKAGKAGSAGTQTGDKKAERSGSMSVRKYEILTLAISMCLGLLVSI